MCGIVGAMASIRQLPGLGGDVRSVESFALVREELIDLIFYTQENSVRHLLMIVEFSLVKAYTLYTFGSVCLFARSEH